MRLPIISSLLLLVACASNTPPASPPIATPPPPVSTEGAIPVTVYAELPFDLEGARAYAERRSIVDFMEQSEDIARPVDGVILSGTWGEPGAVRRLELEDGHFVIERILENEPNLFRYQIWVFTNELGLGVEQIVGTQLYSLNEDGNVEFEWTYAVKPKNWFTAILVRRQIPSVEAFLEGAVRRWEAAAWEEVGRDKPAS